MLRCPALDSSMALSAAGSWPAKGMPRRRASLGEAEIAVARHVVVDLDEVVPVLLEVARQLPALLTGPCLEERRHRVGTPAAPFTLQLPIARSRGPMTAPLATRDCTSRKRSSAGRGMGVFITRMPVTPCAMKSGSSCRTGSALTFRWACMSHRPGIRKAPVPSITCVALARSARPEGTTWRMRSPCSRTSRSPITRPRSTSTTEMWRIATSTVLGALPGGRDAHAASARQVVTRRRRSIGGISGNGGVTRTRGLRSTFRKMAVNTALPHSRLLRSKPTLAAWLLLPRLRVGENCDLDTAIQLPAELGVICGDRFGLAAAERP